MVMYTVGYLNVEHVVGVRNQTGFAFKRPHFVTGPVNFSTENLILDETEAVHI